MALREILAVFGIELDSKQLDKGNKLVDGMVDKLAGFGKVLAGAFGVAAVVGFGRQLIKTADETAKMADSLGLSIGEFQEWAHAADLAGVETEAITNSFARLQRAAADAASGTGPAAEAFKTLGLEAKGADDQLRPAGDLMTELAERLGQVENVTERNALVMDVFGRSGRKLIPLFKEGAEGLARMRAEVEELGFAFTDDFARSSEEFNDNLTRLKRGLQGLAIQTIGAVLPHLVRLTRLTVGAIKSFVGWIKQTKVIQAVLIGFTTKGVLALLRAVPLLIAKLGGLRAVFLTLGRFIFKTLLPLFILEDLLVFFAGGDSQFGATLDAAFGKGTQEKVRKFANDVKDAVKAFKTDDLKEFFTLFSSEQRKSGTASGELWATISDLGLVVTQALTSGWTGFWNTFAALLDAGIFNFQIVWDNIKTLGLLAAAHMSDAWDAAWNAIIAGAQTTLKTVATILSKIPGLKDAAAGLRETATGLEGSKATGPSAVSEIEKDAQRRQREFLKQGEDILNRLGLGTEVVTAQPTPAPAPNINQETNISVTVPPGTPAEQANAVGRAAADGAKRGTSLRGTQAALVPTVG